MKTLIGIIFFVLWSSLAHSQTMDPVADPAASAARTDIGSIETELPENPWDPFIRSNDFIAMLSGLFDSHGVSPGPDTQAILREIGEAELITSDRVRPWLKASDRMEGGRIEASAWRVTITVFNQEPSSSQVSLAGVTLETGTSRAKIQLKVTNLRTLRSKVFGPFEGVRGSTNVTSADLQTAGRLIGQVFRSARFLPDLHYDRWETLAPTVQRGYVAFARMWVSVDKAMPDVIHWMNNEANARE